MNDPDRMVHIEDQLLAIATQGATTLRLVQDMQGKVHELELDRARIQGMLLGGRMIWGLAGTGIGASVAGALTAALKTGAVP